MEDVLTINEVRVLGCLIEKDLTTPEYYPLTLNALVNACNQKSNRTPVMVLSSDDVEDAVDGLRKKQLAWRRSYSSSRVPKFEHNISIKFEFDEKEVAVVCVLLLRGAQTVGEIKGRTGRMCQFGSLDEVHSVLDGLKEKEDGPFVVKLSRQPGTKENRYAHLMAGEVEELIESVPDGYSEIVSVVPGAKSRIEELEDKIESMNNDLLELRTQFEDFKRAFE